MNWKGRTIIIALLLLVAASASGLSYEGLCFSQLRFLDDVEMIEPTVRQLAEEGSMSIDPSDTSIKEFLRSHPGCCAVDRYPNRRIWLDVLTGWNISEVEVNFERNPKHLSDENYAKYYKQYVSVNACGKVLKHGPGTSAATLETANR